jgi:hypothetical protein
MLRLRLRKQVGHDGPVVVDETEQAPDRDVTPVVLDEGEE